MWKVLQISLYVILPLVIGLAAEFLFDRALRKRRSRNGNGNGGRP